MPDALTLAVQRFHATTSGADARPRDVTRATDDVRSAVADALGFRPTDRDLIDGATLMALRLIPAREEVVR